LLVVAERLAAQTGNTLRGDQCIFTASMPDGSHLTILLPPVAVRGPIIELRRPGKQALSLDDLMKQAVLSKDMATLLKAAVDARRNLLVTGGLNTGVSTFINALAALTPEDARLVTVEHTPRLVTGRQHTVSLGVGQQRRGATMREVVSQANRLRSDWLIVDDVDGHSAYEVLLTAAARREGTILGMHGHSAEETLKLIEVFSSATSPTQSLPTLVGHAVQLVVHIARMEDGAHRVLSIGEVQPRETTVALQELFYFRGEFKATGKVASFLRKT
jgi:pilus assembly protein CpaF